MYGNYESFIFEKFVRIFATVTLGSFSFERRETLKTFVYP